MAGGYIGYPAPQSPTSAPGVWPIDEVYTGRVTGAWPNGFDVFGGTVTSYTTPSGTYRVHTFTSTDTLTIDALPVASVAAGLDYLLVSGGGGGGSTPNANYPGGGGGSGATRTGTLPGAIPYSLPIVVGAGGSGTGGSSNVPTLSLPTPGGAVGGTSPVGKYGIGSSGGGGNSGSPTPFTGGSGLSFPNPAGYRGGGGGGDTSAGNPGGVSGVGGNGSPSSINGTNTTYAVGGNAGSGPLLTCPAPPTTRGTGGRGQGTSARTPGQPGVFIFRYKVV